jgi:pimeloyl-ACP methyl ester carboxylesterase
MPEQSEIHFTDEGSGFPVLFIHGFCETHQIWNSFAKVLSKDFRILSIDLPGFGKSELLPQPFTIADVAKKVIHWLRSLHIDSCIVIGHSLGGYVTLAMAEQHPTLFKGFSLFHSTAYGDTEERKLSRNKVIEFVTRNGVSPFIESFIPPLFYDQLNPHIPAVVALASQTKQETLIAYVEAMRDRPERTRVLEQFNSPVLFIAGDKDGGISPESVKKQSELNPKSILHVLPEVAHMGMFEKERLTLELTRGFLLSQSQYTGQ